MLEIEIPDRELWDEKNEVFVPVKGAKLRLEHSLLSLSKWEAKWKKPYLDKSTRLTFEESLDYIRCMTLNKDVGGQVYFGLDAANMAKINAYINDSMTATTFSSHKQQGHSRERITSELIYYWMAAYGIPFECEKWHLNRLMTLIRICSIKDQPPKKMGRKEQARRNSALNAKRRAASHSRG